MSRRRPLSTVSLDLGEPFTAANRYELRALIAVTPQIVVVGSATPPRHLDRIENNIGAQTRRASPPDDDSRERVDDEAAIVDTGPGRHGRQVDHPEPVRGRHRELPFHQIRVPSGPWIGPGCLESPRPGRSLDACSAHEPARFGLGRCRSPHDGRYSRACQRNRRRSSRSRAPAVAG